MDKIKLFCLPYAGGSSIIYNKWKPYLHPRIELFPIELAGRGKRIADPFYSNLNEAVDDIYPEIKSEIQNSQYGLFGHSMGGLIVYDLAQKIRDHNLPAPQHIFFSGRSAPHVYREDDKIFHLMGNEEFKSEVMDLGGTPPSFFEHPELMELFLPLLKNDFKIAETQVYDREINPFDSNISILLGKEDDLNAEECDGWKLHTKKLCSIHHFNGGHFFLHNEVKQIVKFINNTLLGDLFENANKATV